MEEKNRIIHKSAASTSLLAVKVPIEKETAVSVTMENSRIALMVYLVLNSCRMSLLNISHALSI
jgi:hypothetical protein